MCWRAFLEQIAVVRNGTPYVSSEGSNPHSASKGLKQEKKIENPNFVYLIFVFDVRQWGESDAWTTYFLDAL